MSHQLPSKENFAQFLKKNEGLIHLYAAKYCGRNKFARQHRLGYQDLKQIVRIACWMAVEKQRKDIEEYGKIRYALSTYTNMITKYILKRDYGASILEPHNLADDTPNIMIESKSNLDDIDEVEYLQRGLSQEEKTILELRYKEEMTYKDIGAKLNLSHEAIRIKHMDSLNKMREKINEEEL